MKAYIFAKALTRVATTVEYKADWANGTGYFDGAVKDDLGLKPGEQVKFIDDEGRNGIITNTLFGNVVVFQRHIPNGADDIVITSNAPRELNSLVPSGALSEDDLLKIIGEPGNHNVGQTLEYLILDADRQRAKVAAK